MGLNEILTIIGIGLIYASALITTYVNIRLKLKELDVKILRIEKDFREYKTNIDCDMGKLEDKNSLEHGEIMDKIDIIVEKISDIRVHQAESNRRNQSNS